MKKVHVTFIHSIALGIKSSFVLYGIFEHWCTIYMKTLKIQLIEEERKKYIRHHDVEQFKKLLCFSPHVSSVIS